MEKNFREFEHIKIFELGQIYEKGLSEKTACGIAIYRKKIDNWSENNILEIKEIVNSILDTIKVK